MSRGGECYACYLMDGDYPARARSSVPVHLWPLAALCLLLALFFYHR